MWLWGLGKCSATHLGHIQHHSIEHPCWDNSYNYDYGRDISCSIIMHHCISSWTFSLHEGESADIMPFFLLSFQCYYWSDLKMEANLDDNQQRQSVPSASYSSSDVKSNTLRMSCGPPTTFSLTPTILLLQLPALHRCATCWLWRINVSFCKLSLDLTVSSFSLSEISANALNYCLGKKKRKKWKRISKRVFLATS